MVVVVGCERTPFSSIYESEKGKNLKNSSHGGGDDDDDDDVTATVTRLRVPSNRLRLPAAKNCCLRTTFRLPSYIQRCVIAAVDTESLNLMPDVEVTWSTRDDDDGGSSSSSSSSEERTHSFNFLTSLTVAKKPVAGRN